MNFKKLFFLFVICSLVVFFLVSCTESEEKGTENSTNTEISQIQEVTQETVVEKEDTQITDTDIEKQNEKEIVSQEVSSSETEKASQQATSKDNNKNTANNSSDSSQNPVTDNFDKTESTNSTTSDNQGATTQSGKNEPGQVYIDGDKFDFFNE